LDREVKNDIWIINCIWSIATNLAFTEAEPFTYSNLRLVGLILFILVMFLPCCSTLPIIPTIDLNMSSLEFWLSLFAVSFAWFVAFPASIIILDFDLALVPETLVFGPGYQRAWPTNPKPSNLNYLSFGFITEYSSFYFSIILLTEYASIIAIITWMIILLNCTQLSGILILFVARYIRSSLNRFKFDELIINARIMILPTLLIWLLSLIHIGVLMPY